MRTINSSVRRAVLQALACASGLALAIPGRASADAAPADTSTQPVQSGPAKDATTPELQEVVIVGSRIAIATSQEVKKLAPTFVDSISATDIGAFPDKSVSDALQHVPGISVNRLQSNDDSTHPSGEPTNILIRGLTQVRTELNGRDSFSADSGRGLNFNDVSPELLNRADAYKNQTADMIEGGIAGTVDLRTRLPFDKPGPLAVIGVQGDYGDRSKEVRPAFSGLLSDTLDTDFGRFGILGNYSRSHVITRTESVIMDKIDTYCSGGYGTAAQATVNADGSIPCTSNPFGGSGWAFAPDGIRYSQVDYDRTRIGSTVALQYENNDQTLVSTVQYTDSSYHNAWLENASHAILEGTYYGTPAFNPRGSTILGPADGTGPLVFGSDGMLRSGVLTQGHGSWSGSFSPNLQDAINTGSAVPGVPFVNDCGPGFTCSTLRDGLYFQDESRDFDHREETRDISANVKWDITPRLHANFDGQYIDANVSNNDILVASGSMANYQYSVNGDGTPQVQLQPGSNVNYASGGLTNPHNYWIPFIQGHVEGDGGYELAVRSDLKIDLNQAAGGWLDSLKTGVRYADRTQNVRYSTFNWTPIAANWNCNGPGFNADNTTPGAYPGCAAGHPDFKGYGAGIWGTTNFSPFYNGSVYPNGPLVFLNNQTITNFPRLVSALSGATTNSPIGGGYVPICDRTDATEGCFTPSEVEHLEEKTHALYAMLNFGSPSSYIWGINVTGNVGVRAVRTEEISLGSVRYPTSTDLALLAPCNTPLGNNSVVNPSCYLTPQILAFASGGGTPDSYKATHTNWLPSFNVRLGLDDKDFVRFAYSKAMSRPDIGLLRNYVQINSPVINTTPDSPYVIYNSPTAAHVAANVTGYKFLFNSTAGNAALLPEMADQFDLSFERYMGATSAITVGGFYKKLSNTLDFENFSRTFTNGGATETAQIQGPVNRKDGGKVKGVEVAYQTFFDFLPGLWNGLGMQANYTHVSESGVHNTNLIDATSGGGVGAVGAGIPAVTGVVIDSHRLQGVSDNTFNIVGLYEKGPVGVRLAYNWRSRYLTQNLDCCIGLPVFQKAAGFLDGSVRYSVGSHVELSLDVTNLLDTRTVYEQQIFGDSTATPGAAAVYKDSGWSRVERRYQFGVRAKF
jgi:TonB-dependent receptor